MQLIELSQILGNFGELVGALAVVATLIYLAIQIRQNTNTMNEGQRLTKAQTYHARSAVLYQVMAQIANSGELSDIFVKAREDGLEALSSSERSRFRLWCLGQVQWFDNMHFQHELGYLDHDWYEASWEQGVHANGGLWMQFGLLERARPRFRADVEKIVDIDLATPRDTD